MAKSISGKSRKTPMVVVACVVRHGGKLLLIKRAKPPYSGLLSMPGGKIEFGEHVVAAALRETMEEAGIGCKFEKMLGVFSEILEASNGGKMHFIVFVCSLATPSLEVRASDEGELVWIDESKWDEIKKVTVPSDWRIVKDFLFEKNSQMEIREVKMCEEVKNGKICYNLEEFTAP